MGVPDFGLLFATGGYGGLACSLLAAAGVAVYALRRRRGTPRQLALGVLTCLVASGLMLAPLFWLQNRLDVAGPTVSASEVSLWLVWTAVLGWVVPLSTLAGYMLLAAPQETAAPSPRTHTGPPVSGVTALDDPARFVEPLGEGQAWGQLTPIVVRTTGRPLPLTRQVTLLGREADNDVVIEDKRTSRHHAEIRWNDGRPCLLDRGSMNGTLRNSQAVHGLVPLETGDIVQLGAWRYRFERLAPAGAAATRGAAPPVEETRKMGGVRRDSLPGLASQSTQSERLALVAVNGPCAGQRWEVSGALMTIGRDQDCAVHLPDASVSRRHAQIVRQASGYFVADLESSNGTLLNGALLTAPTRLRAGDVLGVGEIELRCEPCETPQSAQEAPGIPVPVGADATVAGTAPPTGPLVPWPAAAQRAE
jgi:pSer/pThr/pTyr-binding forkhead associated (FHA) protein